MKTLDAGVAVRLGMSQDKFSGRELPVALIFEVALVERQADRVVAVVHLEPEGEPVHVEGVAVELLDRGRERLSARVLLPISGELAQPLAVRVELRASDQIPVGAFIESTAWWDGEQQRVTCPTDRSTELEAHVRGRGAIPIPLGEGEFLSLTPSQRRRLARRFPWVLTADEEDIARVGSSTPTAVVDDAMETLGLDREEAEWLKELLAEEE